MDDPIHTSLESSISASAHYSNCFSRVIWWTQRPNVASMSAIEIIDHLHLADISITHESPAGVNQITVGEHFHHSRAIEKPIHID